VNIWWETDARILETWYMGEDLNEPRTLNIAPGSVVDQHYSWTMPSGNPIRLTRAFGHRHFWTTSFTSWIERAGSSVPEIVYQSFDWHNMPSYRYDSLAQNPAPNPAALTDGAASGIVTLNPGDKLHFNCHIEYTDERAATNANAPSPETQGNLKFKNEVYGGEICIMFGNWLGPQLLFPSADSSPIPDVVVRYAEAREAIVSQLPGAAARAPRAPRPDPRSDAGLGLDPEAIATHLLGARVAEHLRVTRQVLKRPEWMGQMADEGYPRMSASSERTRSAARSPISGSSMQASSLPPSSRLWSGASRVAGRAGWPP